MLAGLRSGTIDYIGWQGAAQLNTVDQAESLRRTNPELVLVPWSERSNNATLMNVTKPPYDDIRVRHGMQMALDLESMNNTYFKGYADIIPRGKIGREMAGYHVPGSGRQGCSAESKAIINDPQYEAWYEEMLAATTVEEQQRPIRDMDMLSIERHWMVWGPLPPAFNVHQPWIIGYSGEGGMGSMQNLTVFSRLWVDNELKEEMGH